jgi:hypothetical protein
VTLKISLRSKPKKTLLKLFCVFGLAFPKNFGKFEIILIYVLGKNGIDPSLNRNVPIFIGKVVNPVPGKK